MRMERRGSAGGALESRKRHTLVTDGWMVGVSGGDNDAHL